MKITTELLKEKQACTEGVEKFIEHFPSGEAEYQDVLDKLAELNDTSNADWLLKTIGKTDAVLELDGNVERASLFFAGSIKVTGFLKVDFHLVAGSGIEAVDGIEAGCGIKAGDGIEAGWGIKSGWGIKAGDGIKAGSDFGIFAGLCILLNYWSIDAKVSAKTKPENLVSGFWVESSEVSE